MKGRNRPINLGRYAVIPGRRLAAYSMDITENRVGILRDVAQSVAQRGGDVIYFHLQVNEGGRGMIFLILDATKSTMDFEELRETLNGIDGIGNVDLILPTREGLLIDTLNFPAYVESNRVAIMRDVLLRSAKEELIRRIGPEATDALLYNIGFEMGEGAGEDHMRMARSVGIEDPEDVLKLVTVPLFKTLGYGEADLSLGEDGGSIKLYRNIECEAAGTVGRASCSLIRGMWAGVLTSILGREVTVEEVKCTAAGDGYCELRIILKGVRGSGQRAPS